MLFDALDNSSGDKPAPSSGIRALALMALLVAAEVVLSRFLSFAVWNMKIGFAFLPVALAAVLLGPVRAGVVGAVADFLGAVLFPIGAYFPGFTLTAFLMGAVYGLFLYQHLSFLRVVGAVAVNQLLLSLLLNTLWISILYGSPYGPLFVTRLTQCAILIPVQCLVLGVLLRTMREYLLKKAEELHP